MTSKPTGSGRVKKVAILVKTYAIPKPNPILQAINIKRGRNFIMGSFGISNIKSSFIGFFQEVCKFSAMSHSFSRSSINFS